MTVITDAAWYGDSERAEAAAMAQAWEHARWSG